MMRNIQKVIWLILTILLSSCAQTTNLQLTSSTTPASPPQIIPVPSLITAATPTYSIVIPTATYFAPLATESHQQTYIDPAGWFSASLPIAWKSSSTNVFSGEDGFFEVGYLPEMMYMQSSLSVCQWLANISTNSVYYVQYGTTLYLSHNARTTCTLKTMPGITPSTAQAIIENPHVEAEQRFFYIKTNVEHYEEIINTFVWLRSVDRKQNPEFKSMPVRPEDITFWENLESTPHNLTIKEYILPSEMQNESPSNMIFSGFIPAGVPTMMSKTYNKPSTEELLKTYGYEVRTDPTKITSPQLYKDGDLLIDNIYPTVSSFIFSAQENPVVIFVVRSLRYEECYLIQNDTILELGGCFLDPKRAPILYKRDFLFLRALEYHRIQIETSKGDAFFSFATYFGSGWPVKQFNSWNDHWILGVGDFLIQDGEIINEKHGFEEAFHWQIMNGKPFYFFRKGAQFGISYDGFFLPLDYEEIAHGRVGNPTNLTWMDENTLRFYGKRDEVWYYVIVEVN